mmetsp:Transcript_25502/g.66773  ORF Transcript_25502/g.66773 Transcript_25502/m.66773 type:complete len:159 (+) Transcript_25502:250-726(+)|eukprot:CAMPEP_0182921298 /NCGR_PEP_ID=MMETSP0105_2-20130417/4058_1 /TAXON_ID=81532 ORGANISM="Acanthoeca-like sp., Strain 10tr" /NCGR_SAMPLE_ID=MMETSP0105_2 /ASSEMBLY_ACC=CAM_ASM_000205 /LENGTH=158 /DNA_ID=CAMNT_0025058805 /DNA_START=133 /DNA_END=609 /DNA_ORIENTATION=-
MDCGAADGCDAFWEFVAAVDWPSRPSLEDVEKMMRTTYSANQIKHFDGEYHRLAKRVRATIEVALAQDEEIHFGGGDDHTFMDLPGELVGRGRAVYLDHVNDARKLATFGEGGVHEGFPYIFQPFDERLSGMRNAAAAAAAKPAPGLNYQPYQQCDLI